MFWSQLPDDQKPSPIPGVPDPAWMGNSQWEARFLPPCRPWARCRPAIRGPGSAKRVADPCCHSQAGHAPPGSGVAQPGGGVRSFSEHAEGGRLGTKITCINRKIVAPMEEWTIPEKSMWEFVPVWERECTPHYVHVIANNAPEYQYYLRSVCSRSWCGPCEKMRTWRYRNRIASYLSHQAEVIGGVRHWWFLTRSVRNAKNPRIAFDTFLRTKRKFHMHIQKEWHPFHHAQAWIGVQEITHDLATGYNLHQHVLVGSQRKFQLDPLKIRDRWSDAAGYSAMSHMVRMDTRIGAVAYLGKYISKATWGGLSRGRAYAIRKTLKGRNRIQMKPRTGPPKSPLPGFVMCCATLRDGDCTRDAIDMVTHHGSEYIHHEEPPE